MLTNAAVKAARPRAAAYKLADGDGLHLFVAPNGRRSFRLRFRWHGREQLLTFGQWPEISLDEARERARAARAELGRGVDPRVAGAADTPAIRAFEYVFRRWHAHAAEQWTPVHAADVMRKVERDVLPAIGAEPVAAIAAPRLLELLRMIEARGAIETARRTRQILGQVFGYAIAEGLIAINPAAELGKALRAAPAPVPHAALVDLDECRALLAAVDQLGAEPRHVLASRFLALTAVRLACVRGARWGEIEDLDGPAPLWRVPAERMKQRAAKKAVAANHHQVPLSPAAVAVLRAARESAVDLSDTALIFGDIGEDAIGALYDRAGYAGRHVPHGWRASFSTILNDAMPEQREVIDRALAHAAVGKVEGAYNRAQLLGPRRAVFDAWAAMLAA